MSTVVVDGKALAQQLRDEIALEIAHLVATGHRPPCLAVVLVGDNPASLSYNKGKRRACERAGMTSQEHNLAATATQEDVVDLVRDLDRDPHVDGILVQLPLPSHLDSDAVIRAIDPAKDVDGLHPLSLGYLAQGRPTRSEPEANEVHPGYAAFADLPLLFPLPLPPLGFGLVSLVSAFASDFASPEAAAVDGSPSLFDSAPGLALE